MIGIEKETYDGNFDGTTVNGKLVNTYYWHEVVRWSYYVILTWVMSAFVFAISSN